MTEIRVGKWGRNNNLLVRLIREDDADDLLQVYSDKNALPFFNGDN